MSNVETNRFLQTIAFVGNPNSGKTTLYNALTGANQKTGNFCGVTVDSVAAECSLESQKVQLIDLPGIYTLTQISNEDHEDERITRQFLDDKKCDVIINVIDAAYLERNLYLTLQCLELGLPMVIVLTRTDLVQNQNLQMSSARLQKWLKCPVVQISAKTKLGMGELRDLLFKKLAPPSFHLEYSETLESQIQIVAQSIQASDLTCMGEEVSRSHVIRWMEGEPLPEAASSSLKEKMSLVLDDSGDKNSELDIQIAISRYALIEQIVKDVLSPASILPKLKGVDPKKLAHTLDKVLCHKWLGIPCFLVVMYALFFFAINIGGAFQDSIEQLTTLFLVEGVGELLTFYHFPHWLISLFQGIGMGLSTILTFVPVIGAMFFALSFLEASGYMARAAIVMDRLMLLLGLPGKSFVPMIVGFGCNVPAILGARTLDRKRDRILTVMMSPFMSCGARLAIFTVFVSIFFPKDGHNVVFALYLVGIVMAVLTGLLLKKTLLNGPASPLIMELPAYTIPPLRSLWRSSMHRLNKFVWNATKLIIPVCVVITVMNSVYIHKNTIAEKSVLAAVGQQVTPIFYPMGLTDDNWPATVGLFTGILAKEVVIGSLNTLYTQSQEKKSDSDEPEAIQYIVGMKSAMWTIPHNLLTLRGAFSNPISAKAPKETLDNVAHQEMLKRFVSPNAAFAYLLFILLYVPCVAATAAMVKEVKKGWTIFSILWTTALAYSMAVFFFQASTWMLHPLSSSLWCSGVVLALVGTVWVIHKVSQSKIQRSVPTKIVYI
jgi:ferrous iron transport protein B